MEIWGGRYTNKKGKTESQLNHKRFLIYRDMPKRTLEKVTQQIFFPEQELSKEFKKSQKFKKKYNVIAKASSDYDWQDRAIADDTHISEQIRNKNANTLTGFFGDELDDAIQLPKIIKIQLNEIVKQETEEIIVDGQKITRKIRPTDKIAMIQKLVNSYDTSVKSVGYLGNCGVHKTENKNNDSVKVSADAKAKLDNKTIFDIVNKELGLDED